MKVLLAKSAGFCYGVKRAVELAAKTGEETGGCWMLGDLIHNSHVVEDLARRGVRKTEDPAGLAAGDTVVIRSHGELKSVLDDLEARGVRVGQPDGDPDFHFDKVCVLTAPDSLREEFLAEVAPMCQVIDRGNMLELPVRGYSKASGCLAVAQALGEDLADCYAIGDSANDLEMLQCVGHPLVMGNAPARVQAVAEYVTGTPAEDGLYHAMVHAGLLAE